MIRSATTHMFSHGSLSLDFIGTMSRRSSAPVDGIATRAQCAEWLRATGLIGQKARVSERQFQRAIELREALARIAIAFVAKQQPQRNDLTVLNDNARETKLGATTLGIRLDAHRETRAPIAFALGAIASDAVRLYATRRTRLTRCDYEDCGAVFLTNDRGEPRRWCSMEHCGNRAKAAALRRRRSAAFAVSERA